MEFKISDDLVEYQDAVSFMENRVAAIREGTADELVWFLEHPPLYTAGTSANSQDLLNAKFPVFETGRGGQYTYHGPGQLVAYVMLNLRKQGADPDIKKYIHNLEQWIINSLAELCITGERREGRVGIWVKSPLPSREGWVRGDDSDESKIAAIGVRVRHWVTYHGISINIDPDLSHFGGIVPCGISEHGVCSLKSLGIKTSINEVQKILQDQWDKIFN
ncbi:MAG: lipoate-protein ligase B [Micavibrio aeruginosavorus]|uniref:Octanoyltransferase n=1 Tax=Micavibrio aeruginosavorus TaxID=349221 RepID=A0A2W5FPK7_9BACT|nr:MAG: lipoate-protein ligase B [Micavibrio aeruginosavorus]